ncbi:MAG: MFS transporter, partial [Spirochaetaceae bacterium]|nr:MFS transporter [Spirochaetaceae bacterium]
TSYLLMYAVSNLVFGALTNRISARFILGFGIILNGAAVMAFRLVPPDGIVVMHLLWILCAIGGGVYHPVANVFITRLYPERKGWALGITGMGSGLGYAFGPFLTGFLSTFLLLSWRDISLVIGGLALAGGAAALLGIHDIQKGTPSALPRGEPVPAAKHDGRLFGLGGGLLVFLVFIILIAGVREIGMWTVLDISDFFVSGIHGAQVKTAWVLFFMYLPAVFVQPSAGALSDRIGRGKLSAIALVGNGIALVLTAFVPGGFIIFPYVLMGITQSATVPLLEAVVADFTTPRTRGLIFGIFFTAMTGIGALGPLAGGIFLDAFDRTADSFRALFVGMGILVFLGGIAMIFSGAASRALGLRAESSKSENRAGSPPSS